MTKKTEKVVYDKTCVYTGRRRNGDSAPLQRFEKPDGSEMFYKGIKKVWIGHTYRCAQSSMSTRPERVDTPRIDNAEWDAADALVSARNAEKRAESALAAKQSPALKEAIRVLTPLMKNCGYFERKTLIEYLAEHAAPRKRG